jgi:hypothetical protein
VEEAAWTVQILCGGTFQRGEELIGTRRIYTPGVNRKIIGKRRLAWSTPATWQGPLPLPARLQAHPLGLFSARQFPLASAIVHTHIPEPDRAGRFGMSCLSFRSSARSLSRTPYSTCHGAAYRVGRPTPDTYELASRRDDLLLRLQLLYSMPSPGS